MISIIRRDDTDIQVTVKNDEGNAIDITGYTVYFTVKENSNDSDDDAIITKNITSHSNPSAGITSISLDKTETDIEEGDYLYDFQIKDTDGNISSTERGTFSVVNDITIRTT